MNVIETPLPGVLVLEPQVFGDERGFFLETFQQDNYVNAGIHHPFVQDNHSRSSRGVLRGLHGQAKRPQGKLVRAARGVVFDVVVDANPQSATYAEWFGVELSDANFRQLWIPPGYLHGFLVLSEVADFEYKCTDYYQPNDEIGVIWDDPLIGIEWPISQPQLSEKDQNWPRLSPG